jgi:DNA-directed RNA polymerase specialized sigma24 family protein
MGSLFRRRSPDGEFELLYQRHVDEVYGCALALVACPADAEAVTRTTFRNAYRAFSLGVRPERAGDWLLGIAHDVCSRRFRESPPDEADALPADACTSAELALTRLFDDRLPADELRALRGHLRVCRACAIAARRQQVNRHALRRLLAVPLPHALASFSRSTQPASPRRSR